MASRKFATMRYYFAYGSNMSLAQMQARCPGARAVGPARLDRWRFIITKRGTANIRPEPQSAVFGALWCVQPHHFALLDRWEGTRFGNFRRRHIAATVLPGNRTVTATTYVSLRHLPGTPRIDYMLTAVLPGAVAFDLPLSFIEELRAWLPARPLVERKQRYRGQR